MEDVTIAKQSDPGLEDRVENLTGYDGGIPALLHMVVPEEAV